MVENVRSSALEAKEKKATAIFCPSCGVPRSTKLQLETFLSQKKRLRFQCSACGIQLTFERGWPADQSGASFSMKDVISGTRDVVKLAQIVKKAV